KYVQPDHAYIEVVGKGSDVAEKLKQFGEVKYYDINGNEYEPKELKALPPGLTAERVIDKYLSALGGRQKIEKVQTVKLTYKASAMGQDLFMKIYKSPGKSLMEISNGGDFIFQKVLRTGDDVSMIVMGNKQEVDESEKERIKYESEIFPDLHLEKVKPFLITFDELEGKDVYVVEVNFPKGTKKIDYYDVETGLKLRTENEISTPDGPKRFPLTIDGYKEVDGIKFASRLVQQQGPMSLTFELVEAEVNPKLESSVFK
ncbi:MAG TPA: insulinase family protein, partial [Cyclobacteriaceae bacterium]|nr:insulinase family protein [Cyclobacteriaceae bacterium]